jgi:hypothetical protein
MMVGIGLGAKGPGLEDGHPDRDRAYVDPDLDFIAHGMEVQFEAT